MAATTQPGLALVLVVVLLLGVTILVAGVHGGGEETDGARVVNQRVDRSVDLTTGAVRQRVLLQVHNAQGASQAAREYRLLLDAYEAPRLAVLTASGNQDAAKALRVRKKWVSPPSTSFVSPQRSSCMCVYVWACPFVHLHVCVCVFLLAMYSSLYVRMQKWWGAHSLMSA